MSAAKKLKTRATEKLKILIAEDDRQHSRRLVEFFHQNGFEARSAANGSDLKTIVTGWKPHMILADLLFPGLNALELLRYLKGEPSLIRSNIGVIVVFSHNDPTNVNKAFKLGAKDFIVRPYLYQDLLNRVVLQCRDPRFLKPVDENEGAAHWNLVDLILVQALAREPVHQILFNITKMIAKKMDGVRCSVIRTTTLAEGRVVASSDDPSVTGLKLELVKYPEVQLVMNTKKTVAIDNLSTSRALKSIKENVRSISFNAMILCPVTYQGSLFGVLSLRLPENKRKLSTEELRFMDMASKIISLAISGRPLNELVMFGPISA